MIGVQSAVCSRKGVYLGLLGKEGGCWSLVVQRALQTLQIGLSLSVSSAKFFRQPESWFLVSYPLYVSYLGMWPSIL